MENLKIRVTTKQESKEAQELLFELGYGWRHGKSYIEISRVYTHIIAYCEGKTLAQGYGMDAKKEITLQQLKDMVDLKPIEKEMKEYLDPDNGYDFIKWTGFAHPPESFIEVPEGAIKLTIDDSETLTFWSDDGESINVGQDVEWRDESEGGILSWKQYLKYKHTILWQRESLNDKVASAEVARQEVFKPECFEPTDNVNNPPHYAGNGVECIDAMQTMLTPEQFVGYLRGNAFKYQWRYSNKGGLEDLKKAQWHLNKLIEIEAS